MTTPTPDTAQRRLFNPRVVFVLLFLTAIICVGVILTDHYSQRDRPGAAPASTSKGSLP